MPSSNPRDTPSLHFCSMVLSPTHDPKVNLLHPVLVAVRVLNFLFGDTLDAQLEQALDDLARRQHGVRHCRVVLRRWVLLLFRFLGIRFRRCLCRGRRRPLRLLRGDRSTLMRGRHSVVLGYRRVGRPRVCTKLTGAMQQQQRRVPTKQATHTAADVVVVLHGFVGNGCVDRYAGRPVCR